VAQRTGEPHQTTEASGSYEDNRMIYRMAEIKKLTIKEKVEDENAVNHMSYNSKMQKEKSLKDIGYGSMTVTYHHRMNANHLKKRKSKMRKQKQSILIHSTNRQHIWPRVSFFLV